MKKRDMALPPHSGNPSAELQRWICVNASLLHAPSELPGHLRREATALLAAMEAAAHAEQPITAEEMLRWLEPISLAVKNPPATDDALAARAAATAFAAGIEYPAHLFDPETQRRAMRKFEFWPSVKEILDLAWQRSIDYPGTIAALRNVLGMGDAT